VSALGRHILVEFLSCNPEIMNDVAVIENSMVQAAKEAGATVINSTFHHFSPYGVSGVVVIQESHLAIHTWPEYGYAAVDLFTCGDQVDPWLSFDHLKVAFQAQNYSAIEARRGAMSLMQRNNFKFGHQTDFSAEGHAEIKPAFARNVWFTDRDDDQALSLRYTGEILYREKSDYQVVSILESTKYGRMLTLDNMVMTTIQDEFHYHEMMTHPALLTLNQPKNVLVIGGGDGGTVREVLKHASVEKVTMVEIDGKVVEACKKFLPEIAAQFDNPKLELRIEDGIAFVKNSPDAVYDLVIVDGSDPVGPAEGLFSTEFYKNCYRVLKADGILLTQGESPKFNAKAFKELNTCLKSVFDKAAVSLLFIPTYPTGMWSVQWGVKGNAQMPATCDKEKIKEFIASNKTRYYNEDIHFASLALPNFVKEILA